MIGQALINHLTGSGHQVFRLVRHPRRKPDEREWDPEAGVLDPAHVEGIDAVINLSGAGIADRPWTRSYIERLYSSRIRSTRTLVRAMRAAVNPPAVFISQSGSGYYGERGAEVLDENSASGTNLMADICRKWELAATTPPGATRTVLTRTGVVLTPRGGALEKLLLPLRLGAGGALGDGSQWWPWISLRDEVRAMEFLLTADCAGPVNLCAPEAATLQQLVDALGAALNRPTFFNVPARLLTALMGQLAKDLVLASTRMEPHALLDAGFRFEHPRVEDVVGWVADSLSSRLLVPKSGR